MSDTAVKKNYDLPERLVLYRAYHCIPMDGDRVLLADGHDSFVIKGAGIERLLPDIFASFKEEVHTEAAIARLAASYPAEGVVSVLSKLHGRRVLQAPVKTAADNGLNAEQDSYFRNFTDEPGKYLGRLSGARVAVFGLGPLGGSLALGLSRSGVGSISLCDPDVVKAGEAGLCSFYNQGDVGNNRAISFMRNSGGQAAGWSCLEEDWSKPENFSGFDYFVACSEKYQPGRLERINDLALRTQTPFTWACLDGHKGLVGPTVLPHETACFRCYETRVMSNADHPEELAAYTTHLKVNGNNAEFGYLLPHIMTLSGMLLLEVIKDLSGLTPPITYNGQLEINLLTLEYDLHPVLKVPRCPACSRALVAGPPVRPFMEKVG